MNKKRIYWNNVCILSRMEEENNNRYIEKWKNTKDDIFEFEYFGLGRKKALHHTIEDEIKEGGLLADALICTDLDVLQDRRYLLEKLDRFKELKSLFPVRQELRNSNILHASGRIIPAIVIPMVMAVNRLALNTDRIPWSFRELLEPEWEGKVILGGIDTSAGKSILMGIWYLYGEDAVHRFIRNSRFATVPAQAFQLVRMGTYPVAVVPTIFSGMQGNGNIEEIWPEDGAVAIPSYVAIKENAPDSVALFIKDCLFNDTIQEAFSSMGRIIPAKPGISVPENAQRNGCRVVYPDWEWIERFDMEIFNKICSNANIHRSII